MNKNRGERRQSNEVPLADVNTMKNGGQGNNHNPAMAATKQTVPSVSAFPEEASQHISLERDNHKHGKQRNRIQAFSGTSEGVSIQTTQEARHLRHGSKNGFSKLHFHTKISKPDANSASRTAFDDEPEPVAPTAPTLPSPTAPVSHSSPPGRVDGLRPTAPGHSPGIGHSLHN
nr:Precursor of CEP5 [Ipomoea batatas]